jgi:hypothetical protein
MKMTFQEIRIIATGPCIANQLRDVNTICRRSWYIAAHVWKIYDFKIEVVPLIINWQKSDIWSQASYKYPISWEAFFVPSDSYFLFAEELGYHRYHGLS